MKNFLFILLISATALISCKSDNKKQKTAQESFSVTLFKPDKKDGSCYRIPAIITASNGDLIALADQRVGSCADLKGGKDINIAMRRSSDNGKTWSNTEVIIDYPLGQSASDPSLILDKQTKTIFLFFNYMDLEKEPNVYYLKYVTSTNNGQTWSEPVDITSQISKPEWHHDFKFITSGRGTQTKDGTLLHTLVNLQRGLFVFKSQNHGESWTLINTPIKPADESKIIELKDGRWMINSRVNGLGHRYVHTSSDHGQSWTSQADSTLIDPSCNASLIKYVSEDSDILLFSNNNHSTERKNLCLKFSQDNGKTWSKKSIIDSGSTAYSSATILKNGQIGILFEKDNYQKIEFKAIPFVN